MSAKPGKKIRYSPELWNHIEAMFKTGQFNSIQKLHEHCTKLLNKCPSIDSMKQRFAKHKISKTDYQPAIEKEIEKLTVDLFAERGLPKEEVVDRVIEGITCANKVKEELLTMCKESLEKGDGVITEASVMAIDKLFARMSTSHTYIKTYLEWTGIAAPKKIGHSNKGEAFKGPDYRSIPAEELSQRLLARLKRLNKLDEHANSQQ